MYTVKKTFEISAAHKLRLPYDSPCSQLHGHNWRITVWCRSENLSEDGMVIDFAHIRQKIHGRLDHKNLNSVLSFNPTAENIADWICRQIPLCYKVEVQESENNIATYEEV